MNDINFNKTVLGIFCGAVDWDDNPVERGKSEYPYSYQPFVILKKKQEYKQAVYSDRLLHWDWDKHNELCRKHFGNEGQIWFDRSPEKIEAFLRDYNNNPELKLVGIMEGCNVGNGYPYWIFMYD